MIDHKITLFTWYLIITGIRLDFIFLRTRQRHQWHIKTIYRNTYFILTLFSSLSFQSIKLQLVGFSNKKKKSFSHRDEIVNLSLNIRVAEKLESRKDIDWSVIWFTAGGQKLSKPRYCCIAARNCYVIRKIELWDLYRFYNGSRYNRNKNHRFLVNASGWSVWNAITDKITWQNKTLHFHVI